MLTLTNLAKMATQIREVKADHDSTGGILTCICTNVPVGLVRLSVCLSVCLSLCPSVCLSVRPSVRLSVSLSVRPSVCLSLLFAIPLRPLHRSSRARCRAPSSPRPTNNKSAPLRPPSPPPSSRRPSARNRRRRRLRPPLRRDTPLDSRPLHPRRRHSTHRNSSRRRRPTDNKLRCRTVKYFVCTPTVNTRISPPPSCCPTCGRWP